MLKSPCSLSLALFALAVCWASSEAAGGQPSAVGAGAEARPVIRIWPGKVPGTEGWTHSERVTQGAGGSKTYTNVVDPTLTVFLPEPEKANGAAVIICPGGAMRMVGISDRDSTAEWLNSQGIAAFILKYRVVPDTPPAGAGAGPGGAPRAGAPGMGTRGGMGGMRGGLGMGGELSFRDILDRDGNANPAPDNPLHVEVIQMAIADGHQAIRLLRRDAEKYHIDPHRIGIMGFSAGGGVAVGTAVTESEDAYPDFVATVYGPSLVDVKVPRQAAPLYVAVMDGHFNVTNGCMVLAALWKEAGRPIELHVYDHANGPASGMPITNWTDRFHDWLRARRIVTE